MSCSPSVTYQSKLVFKHFLRRSNVGEEGMQQVSWRLRVDLLLAEVNVRYFNRLGWREAEHLL